MKAEFIHHIGIAPCDQHLLLTGGEVGGSALGQLRLGCGRAKPIQPLDHRRRKRLQGGIMGGGEDGDKAPQSAQFQNRNVNACRDMAQRCKSRAQIIHALALGQ